MVLISGRLASGLCLALVIGAASLAGGCGRSPTVEQRVQSAEAALSREDYATAGAEVDAALKADPSNPTVRLLSAELALLRGNPAVARAEATRARGADAGRLRTLMPRLLVAEGRPEEALIQLEAAGLGDELTRGDALLALGKHAEALRAYELRLAVVPGDVDAILGRARALTAAGRGGEALQALEVALPQHRESARFQLRFGLSLLAEGRLADAETALSFAAAHLGGIPAAADRLEAVFRLAGTRLQLGNVDGAAAAADQLETLGRQSPALLWVRIQVAEARGDRRAALETAQQLVQALPNEAGALVMLGSLRAAAGELDTAVMYLERAVEIAPDSAEARKALARALARQNRLEDASAALLPLAGSGDFDEESIALLMATGSADPSGIRAADRIRGLPEGPGRDLALATASLMAGDAAAATRILEGRERWEGYESRRQKLRLLALSAGNDKARMVEALDAWVARDASGPDDIALAAALAANAGDTTTARRIAATGRRRFPGDPGLRLMLARAELAAGNAASAEELALAGPVDPAAALVAAQAAVMRGDRPAAVSRLRAALEAFPASANVRAVLARLLATEGKGAEALALLQAGLKDAPRSKVLLLTQGELRMQSMPGKAVESFGQAVAAGAADPAVRMRLAEAAMRAGNPTIARRELNAILGEQPGYLPALQALVQLEVAGKRYSAARGHIERAAAGQLQPGRKALLEASVAAAERSPKAAADGLLAEARRTRDPQLVLAAARLVARESPAGAMSIADDWLRTRPGDVGVRIMRSELHLAAGNSRAATADLEAVVAGGSPTPVVLNNLAWLYLKAGDARAVATAQRALAAAPWFAQARDTLGLALVAAGRAPEAVEQLTQARSALPQDPAVALHLAQALAAAGQRAAASELLERTLREHPRFAERGEAEALLARLRGSR